MNIIIHAVIAALLALLPCSALGQEDAEAQPAGPRVIEVETTVSARRADVWNAWSTTQGAQEFFAPRAHIELRTGGAYEVYFNMRAPEGQQGSEGCRVLSYIPEEMISFTWNAPPQFPDMRWRRTFVVVRLDDAGDETGTARTRVRLAHAGWEAVAKSEQADAVFDYFSRVWPAVLQNLTRRFDSGPIFPGAPGVLEPDDRPHFVYFIRPARDALLTEGPSEQEREHLRGHVDYIKSLLAGGQLVFAGPAMDPPAFPRGETAIALEIATPGIVIFRARDLDEAREVMENDPAVKAGVFKGRVNAFNLAFQNR